MAKRKLVWIPVLAAAALGIYLAVSFIFGDASQVWDIDLVISAHNHGGQVVLPFAGGLYGGDQGWFPQYVHGLYHKDNLRLFITSGLGTDREKFPRFNNPPEIAVLDVTL